MQRSCLAVILCLAFVTIITGEENTTDQNVLQQEDRAYGFYRPNNGGNFRPGEPPCAARLAPAIEAMRRLEDRDSGSNGVLELRGVSLHQPLQGEPTVDMYVTDMKIKGLKQTHLERCRFSRSNSTLSTTLMLPELLARGTVRLRDSSALGLLDWLLQPLTCNMTIRMRYAPLEIQVIGDPRPNRLGGQALRPPPSQMTARFLPESDERTEFRGCEEPIMHRRHSLEGAMIRTPFMVRQMEVAFLRGIRDIMSMYMERQLRNSMTDALMSYMGYTLSYG